MPRIDPLSYLDKQAGLLFDGKSLASNSPMPTAPRPSVLRSAPAVKTPTNPLAAIPALPQAPIKTAHWVGDAARAVGGWFGRAPAAVAPAWNNARQFGRTLLRSGEPGAEQALRTMPRGWAGGTGHAAQLPTMALYGAGGNMVGGEAAPELSTNVGGININLPGILAGAALGHRGIAATGFGRTMARPAANALGGSMLGYGADVTSGALTGSEGRPGIGGGNFTRLGALSGLVAGFGGNRAGMLARNAMQSARQNISPVMRMFGDSTHVPAALRDAASRIPGNMSRADRVMGGANQFFGQVWEGSKDPIHAVGRGLRRFFTGGPSGNVGHAGMMTGIQQGGRRAGQLALTVPLGIGAAGMGYNALTGRIGNDVNEHVARMYGAGREQIMADTDDYMHQRGFLNTQGQFDPTVGVRRGIRQVANPFLQMMGFQHPDNMSGGQRAAGMGGPLMAGVGALTGNPLMAAAGAGAWAHPFFSQRAANQPHPPGTVQHPVFGNVSHPALASGGGGGSANSGSQPLS